MNNKLNFNTARGAMIAAVSLSGLLALAGCEERPYPAAAKSSYAEQPKAPPAQLAGAPATEPSYEQPKPAYEQPKPAETYTQPARTYAPPPRAYDPPAIVAMAPVPNPGEGGEYGRRRVHGHYGPATTYTPAPTYGDNGYAPEPRRPGYHKPVKAPAPVAPTYAAKPPVVTPPVYKTPAPKPAYAKAGAATAAAVGAVAVAAKVDAKLAAEKAAAAKKAAADKAAAAKVEADKALALKAAAAKAEAAKLAAAKADAEKAAAAKAAQMKADAKTAAAKVSDKAKAAGAAAAGAVAVAAADVKAGADKAAAKAAAPVTPAAGNSADRSTRLATVQSTLTDAISKGAVLKTPDRFTANQPADVTLTIPAGFADTLRSEAQKNGLADAAASVELTALLSGDGFSVTPDETLRLPLTVGQPTEFRWTVTALPGAKGPLHADVGADLLGGGSDTLALGSVQKQAGLGIKLTPRVLGATLLVLIAGLLVAWLARGRGPTRSASARRASRAARGRPLDMAEDTAR